MADNTLTIKQKSTLPVSKTRQDKSLFRSLSDTYLPPVQPVAKRTAATTAACVPAASVTDATARCEPIPAFPLLPETPTCSAWPPAAPAAARCEPIPAFPLRPETPTGPVWPSAASTPAKCEPLSPDQLTPASRAGLWSGTMAARSRCAAHFSTQPKTSCRRFGKDF